MYGNKKVKIGVFGAGRGMVLLRILAEHPDAEVTAVCDINEEYLKTCSRIAVETDSNLALYSDFDKFFEHEMDAVVLANYANDHAPYAIKFLLSGRHVLSELMPVTSLGQAVSLVESVEKSGKVYAYGENCCFYPATMEMKRLYENSEIGEFLYGEGEYIHDCEPYWPLLTNGQKDHWRNWMFSSFYCSHSLGPIIYVTGKRPVKVTGFEAPPTEAMMKLGYNSGISATEMVQMDNGAIVKSLHGGLRREPYLHYFSVYGTEGSVETDRWHEGEDWVHLFKRGMNFTDMELDYRAKFPDKIDLLEKVKDHGGSDIFIIHYFIEKLIGKPGGENCIDIYKALDMSLSGLLAHKSICNGNATYDVPDFRNREIREVFRNET